MKRDSNCAQKASEVHFKLFIVQSKGKVFKFMNIKAGPFNQPVFWGKMCAVLSHKKCVYMASVVS